jgi:serine/threonine protein kinase
METSPPDTPPDPPDHDAERRRAEDLFQEVIELPAAERAARLASFSGDNAVRAEVEMMLKLAADDLRGFLDGPIVAERKLAALEGRQVGPYLLRQLIGEGGFGTVYLAEQKQPFRRKVAVKLLKQGLDSKEVVARFEAERQALALMDHPSIAKVFDAGETEDGLPYFVMEHVAGQSIIQYCDAYELAVNDRIELFLAVAAAIQHAHQKGIIHRDIKPTNILVTSFEGAARAKVIDFGIAKAASGQRLTEKTLATRLHMLVGTPAYMSPEQAELNVSDVDTRADIYSLGVLLYELLTGTTPIDSKVLEESGIDEMRRLIRETEPRRPSSRLQLLPPEVGRAAASRRRCELPRLVSAVRGDLDWIVLKALEKDRTRRYATASDLAADLQRFLRHEAVTARPPSRLYLLRKTVRRHRTAFGVAAAIVLLLAAGVAVSSWQMVRAQRAEEEQRELRLQAEAARNESGLRAYAADMKAASIALGEGNLGQAASLLERYLPKPGEPDVRGFEWRYLERLA